MIASETVILIFAALVGYAYLVYPPLVWVLSRLFGTRQLSPQVRDEDLPSATLLLCAFNEEQVIKPRLENALAMDYPRDRLSILLASDGSTDETVAIASTFASHCVKVLPYRQRHGKASALNAAMEHVTSELVILSDANTDLEPDAARRLARWFSDPTVGVVCGRLVLTDPRTGSNADSLYWKYETFLKKCEGRLGALLGSNGAIYAIRRGLFVPIPPRTIVDDLVIPLFANLRTPFRIIYDPSAMAHEETARDLAGEFRRRSRIGAGGFQAIALLAPLLNPARGWIAFTFLSHKLLRWLCPFFLIGMLLCTAIDWENPTARALFLGQLVFYAAAALVGGLSTRLPRFLKVLRLLPMFVGMNLALFFGFWRWIRGVKSGTWTPTQRTRATDEPSTDSPPNCGTVPHDNPA